MSSEQPEIPPSSDYVSEMTFDALHLSEPTRNSIRQKGYTRPTPVQSASLGPILAGRDVIVRSKTGTGKTAAFGIPLVEIVDSSVGAVQGIVLCNTRELALQVATEVQSLGLGKGVQVVAIYGGASADAQIAALKSGAQIVVGTPGRILDLMERKQLRFDALRVAVLDEADEMLGVGFFDDVMRILGKAPRNRQTLLFSATLTPDIEQIIRTHLRDPQTILLSGDTYTVAGIRNIRYFARDEYPKPRNLLYLIQLENPEAAIVFCNTRDDVNLVATVLSRNGYESERLSGELSQTERERVMIRVRRGEVRFLVATDLAARGIDISDLTHVINYSLPEDPSVYLHRIGRTGRIGKTGTAVSLVRGSELVTLSTLERKFSIVFETKILPTAEEAHVLWCDTHVAELRSAIGSQLYDAYLPLAQELRKRQGGDALVAFALKYFFAHHRTDRLTAQRRDDEVRLEQEKKRDHDRRLDERRQSRSKPRLESAAEGPSELAVAGSPSGEVSPASEAPVQRRRSRAKPVPTSTGESPVETASSPSDTPAESARPARTRLYVTLGGATVDADTLRTALVSLSGQPADAVLTVEAKGTYAYVNIAPSAADAFLALQGASTDAGVLGVEVARPPVRRRRRTEGREG